MPRLPWHELDEIQKKTIHFGPNVKKLMIHWFSVLVVPVGGGISDVMNVLSHNHLMKKHMKKALDNTMTAIDAVKAAPNNTFGDDDEAIAAEILRQIDIRKKSLRKESP